jgi:hypothetical protein
MNLTRIDNTHKANRTSLQGYLTQSFAQLVAAFGEPTCGDGYKIDASWEIEFEGGTVATIYNWKNGPSYCGDDGPQVEQITEWNIGGFDDNAVFAVAAFGTGFDNARLAR